MIMLQTRQQRWGSPTWGNKQMKDERYIWTFWTGSYGYLVNMFDVVYLALSVELIKQFSNNLTIYVDERGFKEINSLRLEANHEVVRFDIDKRGASKFAAAKLLTMAKQKDEFCHIDNDLFLFKRQLNIDAGIVVQSLEEQEIYGKLYKEAADDAIAQSVKLCKEQTKAVENYDYTGYNCGYVLARDLDLVQRWTHEGLKIADQWELKTPIYNIFLEQHLLHALKQYGGYDVKTLFPLSQYGIEKTSTEDDRTDFEMAGYTHLMGFKNSMAIKGITFFKILKNIYKLNAPLCERIFEKYKHLHNTINFEKLAVLDPLPEPQPDIPESQSEA